MRKLAMLVCLAGSLASGQSRIQAPIPSTPHHSRFEIVTHYSLLAGVAGTRAADWAATSQAMRQGFVEGELPSSIAKSKPGLALFESGAFAVEAFASFRLFHRHPRLAILGDAVVFGVLSITDIHSFRQIRLRESAAGYAAECPSTTNPICGR